MKVHSPQIGVQIWRNDRNRFVVFELHYSADPAKRDPAFIASIRASMPIQQFNMEYEKSWDSYSGMPVYGDFAEERHCLKSEPEAWVGLPLLRGWDFGLTPACVVAQLQGSQLVVLREFTDFNMGAEQFCEKHMPQITQAFPNVLWFDFADPAGVARAQSDATSCFEVLGKFGITPIPGPVVWETRREAVEHFLTRKTRDGECFQIWEPGCKTLVRGFKGGYRYPEKASEREPDKLRPIKDVHSHPHDALQYICAGVRAGGLRNRNLQIPSLSYFQGSTQ